MRIIVTALALATGVFVDATAAPSIAFNLTHSVSLLEQIAAP